MPLAGVLPLLTGVQEPVMLGSVIMPPLVSPAISGCPQLAAIVSMWATAWIGVEAPPLTGYSVTKGPVLAAVPAAGWASVMT